jgi:hypothetical protein
MIRPRRAMPELFWFVSGAAARRWRGPRGARPKAARAWAQGRAGLGTRPRGAGRKAAPGQAPGRTGPSTRPRRAKHQAAPGQAPGRAHGPPRPAECTEVRQRQVSCKTVAVAAQQCARAAAKSRARMPPGRQSHRRDAPLGPLAARPAAGASCHGHQEPTEQRRTSTSNRQHATGSGARRKGPCQWLRSSA